MHIASFRTLTTLAGLTAAAVASVGCADSTAAGGEAGSTGDGADSEPRVIFPLTELTFLDASDDPLEGERPETVDCPELGGWYAEGDGIEINTASCNYFAASEGAVTSAREGELLELTLSHFDLTAPEPAEAHVALRVGGEQLYEEFIPIPGPGAVYDLSLPLPSDVREGTLLEIHLHNHGQNTWNIGPVTVRPAD